VVRDGELHGTTERGHQTALERLSSAFVYENLRTSGRDPRQGQRDHPRIRNPQRRGRHAWQLAVARTGAPHATLWRCYPGETELRGHWRPRRGSPLGVRCWIRSVKEWGILF